MIKLRDYQEDALDKAQQYLWKKGGRSGIIHLPTGTGKTVITTNLINRNLDPRKGYRTLIVGGVNRSVNFQMLQALRKHFPYMNGRLVSAASSDTPLLSGLVMERFNDCDARTVVGSIQTLTGGVDLKKLSKPSYPLSQPIESSDFTTDKLGNIYKSPMSSRPHLISERMDQMLANGGLFDAWIHDECFAAGTLIDGQPIEAIKVGDFVTAFNEDTGTFEPKQVKHIFVNKPKGAMVKLKIEDKELICTENHPIFTKRGWVSAGKLTVDDAVGSRFAKWVRVDSVEIYERGSDDRYGGLLSDGLVYNLEVEDLHTYVANGIVVHNCHHAPSDGSVYIIQCLHRIHQLIGRDYMKVIGNTATPARADDRGLHTLFDTVMVSYTLKWMQTHGYLAPFADPPAVRVTIDMAEVDEVGNGTITDERQTIRYVDNWAEIVCDALEANMQGRKMFGFWSQYNGATPVQDSIYVTEVMNKNGIRAAHVDGEKCVWTDGSILSKNAQRDILDRLARGELDIVNNVGVLIEGVDVPEVDGIVLGQRIASDNPVRLTQIIGRGLRLAEGKADLKILDLTGQQLVINSIADLTGYTVDPTTGNYKEELDIDYIVAMFQQLWQTRTADVALWRHTQKRYKDSTVAEAFEAAFHADVSERDAHVLKECVEFLLDENRLAEGSDLKDVRQDGRVRGVNATYELAKIIYKSDGNWYADDHSAMMSISVSEQDSFVIVPPNHTKARIAAAACAALLAEEDHPLKEGKTETQIVKMIEFFNKAQELFQNFTLWHMTGAYYNTRNKNQLWVMENEALDVLEADAMAYARDNVENYVAKFGDKKKSKSWEKHEASDKQRKAAAQVLEVSQDELPEDVKTLQKGALARFINHTAAVKALSHAKSPISQFEKAIEQIKELV